MQVFRGLLISDNFAHTELTQIFTGTKGLNREGAFMAKKPVKTKVKSKRSDVGFKRPPKEHQFKKGQSGNPLGVNVSPEKRALKELTSATVADAIKKALTCTEQELKALLEDPATPVGYKIILRSALDASEQGAYSKFDHILERAIGKVSVKVDMTSGGLPLGTKLEDKEKVKTLLKEIENEI